MLNNLRRGDKIITSGGIIGTVNKVADNRELQVQVSENVEIKIAPGMVADLYTSNEPEKKQPVKENKSEKKGGLLSPHWEDSVRAFQKIVIKSMNKSINNKTKEKDYV